MQRIPYSLEYLFIQFFNSRLFRLNTGIGYYIMSEMDFKNIQDQEAMVFTRHFGAVIPFGQGLDGEPKYVLGPHYLVFFGTWIFSCCLSVFILTQMYKMLTPLWFALTLSSNIVFLLTYLNIGFSYPGIASRFQQPSEETKSDSRYCKPCKIVREPGTVHCLDCDLCILNHDHHCPWIGKCVGGGNLSAFYSFLCMCFGNLIFILVCVLFGQKQMSPPS